ncbi:hypothetical protein LRP50_12320 [Enterovibrio sp. ZSDZ42]|uniref:Uncharacterized protein n=1 Tax=Enterovibrio gelatinilyticus TaxID=2899819 RepID=A0ABT5R186_9GAMM|nr:hypothetical protein [Enterovibrio sp. ZSDZ42]MDD1793920.1 hypothetical protein [Enterovibrio sp. ZSDZ42]
MKKVIALIVTLIITNVLWLFVFVHSAINHGVTMTYHNASYEYTIDALNQAIIVANENLVGKSINEVRDIIKLDVTGSKPFVKEGCLYISQLCLKLNDEQVVYQVEFE